jgi:hypothetical protein
MNARKDSNLTASVTGDATRRFEYKTICQTFDDDLDTIREADEELASVQNSGEWFIENMTVSSHYNPYEAAFIHSRVITLVRYEETAPDGERAAAEEAPSNEIITVPASVVGIQLPPAAVEPDSLLDEEREGEDEPTVEERLMARLSGSLIFGPPKQPVIVDPATVPDGTAADGDVLTETEIDDTAEILAVPHTL